MKTKFSGILTLFLALVVQLTFAQEKTISGTISDENGLPLPGVNIIVKGTSSGTQTDFDGNYSLSASKGEVLSYSFVGYKETEKTVGASNTISFAMDVDVAAIDEVVITALGIKREKQALGYSTQEVKAESLERTGLGDTNIANALNGVVTGVDIVSASGDVGSPSSIVVRGVSSLTGSNQALFVVDGIPIDNSSHEVGGATDEISSVNRAGDIDYTNVESISVLKGGAATVLYGERGANGVILITTKKGVNSGKLNIDINSSYTFSTPNKYPEFQTNYARGRDGDYSNVTHWSWGPSYAGNPVFPANTNTDLDADGIAEDVSGRAIPYYANNYENWFNTGTNATNNISLSGANEKGNFRLGYTRTDQNGIVPNSSLKRHAFSINGGYNLSDKISVGAQANYIRTNTNKAASGVNGWGGGIGYWHHMWDINRPWKDANGNKTWFSGSVPDPNWIVYEDNELSEVNRLFGGMNISWEISKWANLAFQVGLDTYSDNRERYRPLTSVESAGNGDGDSYVHNGDLLDTNSQLVLSGEGGLSDKIGMSYSIGHTVNESKYKDLSTIGTTQILPGFYTLDNYVTITTNPYQENYRVVGLFGDLTFDYNKTLYLGFTGRNDWSSTLPKDNNSYFYPSVNTSLIFSKLLENKDIINFGKIRASIAQTGKSADPYQIKDVFVKDGDNVLGNPLFTASNIARNPNLKPELSTEWELGLELKLLENKIGLDFAYYDKLSEDQIIEATVSPSTGYSSQIVNAGDVRNKGIEIGLSFNDLVKIGENFNWGVNLNFTKNTNEVESLADGFTDQIVLGSGWWSSTQRVARVGMSAGTIIGRGYTRDEGGNILVGDDGLPLLEDGKILGDVFPDWKLGINSNVSYKNVNLSFLFDIKKGGDVINDSEGWWVYSGLAKSTENRYYEGDPNASAITVIDGVNANTGLANNVAIPLTNSYYHDFVSFNDEALVEDASWVRLRNVALSYNLPQKYADAIGFRKIQLGVAGTNLWLDTKYSGKDPETSGRGVTNNNGYDLIGAPATKSYSFNAKFGF